MPLKIVSELNKKAFSSQVTPRSITLDQIKQLSAEYQKNTYKIAFNNPRSFDPNFDTKAVWFPLKEVLDFLAANNVDLNNPTDYGIRIYFGHHMPSNDFQPSNSNYLYRDTAILVATKKAGSLNSNLLSTNFSVSLAGGGGEGLDNGTLCPPELDCIL